MKRTISQTPAPMKDRVYGSKKNRKGSSKDLESAKSIVFDEKTLNAVESKVKSHNAKYPQKKITLSSAKAVVRRGMGAYSGSHRPTISGGKPNSRNAWGLARLNAFLYKIINGESKSGKYSQDNDLINELGYKVAKYNEGGLIAPNGKPSNLNPQQYKLVRTKAFKDWFGDWENDPKNASKVVDENGEPLVVYHGTDKTFNVFRGTSIFFVADKNIANLYAKYIKNGHQRTQANENPIVYACFLNIKSILIEKIYGSLPDKQDELIELFYIAQDGILLKDTEDFGGIYDQYIVFNSNQIKLADGTNTTFDGNNPDIRFDVGGNVEDFISKGIVELKMFDTKPEHAKEYGFDVKNPLYVQSICITENERLKGIGKKVLDYIDEYAVKNGHDLIFGHITQKASFTKNSRTSDLCDIDLIKEFLISGGYSTIKGNDDFYKVIKTNPDIRFNEGGGVDDFETETRNLIAVLKKAVLFETGEEKAETERLIKELESELPTPPKEEPKYAYLMTLDEYLNSGIPQLITEYEKFIRKNQEYLGKYGYGKSINRYTLPEALELGKSSPFYSENNVMGEPNTNAEKTIRKDFGYSITREFDDEFDIETPDDVVNKNREYRAKLLQHFTEKELTYFEPDYKKTNKRVIKNSMDNRTYFKLIKEGKLDISRLEDITESVGVRITKETYSADKGAELKEFLKSIKVPQQSYQSLLEFGKKIKIDLEPIKQNAYDREYARYKTNILESVGKTLRQDRLELLIPFWYQVVDVDKNVIRTSRMYSGREYYEEKYEYTIKSLKNDWEEQLSKAVEEFVEVLMFKIVTTIIKTVSFVKIPFASVKTKAVKIGAKGFEGIYEINFTDGSKFDLVTEGIEAGGYNIQAFHYRYISKIENMILPNGEATKSDSHFREYKEVKRFDGGGLTEKPDTKRNLSKYELEAIKRSIEDPLLSPRLKESFQKLLNSRKIDENVDFSRFPEGKYIDPYDFSGYEYMRNKNEEKGVSFLLTGEYELVSKAIYERDYSMWLFYNYTARINISLENARRWVKQAQDYFINSMPIPVHIRHDPKSKDGRSYASWMKGPRRALELNGIDPSFSYNGMYYGNFIGMVANGDNKKFEGWGAMYPEKKTGLYVPEFTETSFHFNTIMHEFAHCLDFQTQLVNNIKKYEGKKSSAGNVKLNTEEMTQLEKELYGEIIRDEESVTAPITNHFDYFIDSLIKILRASSSGEIPLTQKFEQQALDVQIALSGLYGDILLEQRERKKQQSQEIAVLDEARENKRFTWQSKRIPEFIKYVQTKAIQKDMANELSKTSSGRKISLPEILELDSLINQFAEEYLNIYAVKYPSKMDTFYSNLKEIKNEANRIIANHYDNIKRDYQFGFYPVTELDIYLSENCRMRDFRDYKSWKECSEGIIREKLK